MTAEWAEALAALTTGIYVLTVREDDRRHAMSSSWVTQVSGDPALLAAAIDCRHWSHAIVERTGRFALNVLGRKGKHLEDFFYSPAARTAANLESVAWDDSPGGLPFLRDALLSLECSVRAMYPAGDHTLFVASIEHVTHREDDQPLTSQDLEYVYVGEVVRRTVRR
jgi:flavin reductase (DIM6/NTAB) family NADH-FMN oxidoreductase RutF